jgi:glycosyltransferase involved in cell wall biosynthesis
MRVVILSDTLPPDSPGGAGKVAWMLGQGLIAAGHQITFITSTRGPSKTETRQGFPVYSLHSDYAYRWSAWYGLFNPQVIVPLNKLLRDLKPDIVHAHGIHIHLSYHSLAIARVAAKAATVFTAHDAMPFAYGKVDRFVDPTALDQCQNWNYRLPFGYNWRQTRFRWNPARNLSIRHTMRYYVDERIAVSHELKRALEANSLPPFEVVHNGVDPAIYENIPNTNIAVLRQRLKLDNRRMILFGGRINPAKGGDQLLAALRLVKQRVPDVALLILARPSDYLDKMRQDNPDLADQIVIGGWMEDAELTTAYKLVQVVTSPSVYLDPFPTINLEAMAAGQPVVTTCFGGSPEAVSDGETGFVVNPFNVEDLADRYIRLLTDEDLRRRMGAAGQARVRQHFTLEHQTEAMLDIYERARAKRDLRL